MDFLPYLFASLYISLTIIICIANWYFFRHTGCFEKGAQTFNRIIAEEFYHFYLYGTYLFPYCVRTLAFQAELAHEWCTFSTRFCLLRFLFILLSCTLRSLITSHFINLSAQYRVFVEVWCQILFAFYSRTLAFR